MKALSTIHIWFIFIFLNDFRKWLIIRNTEVFSFSKFQFSKCKILLLLMPDYSSVYTRNLQLNENTTILLWRTIFFRIHLRIIYLQKLVMLVIIHIYFLYCKQSLQKEYDWGHVLVFLCNFFRIQKLLLTLLTRFRNFDNNTSLVIRVFGIISIILYFLCV